MIFAAERDFSVSWCRKIPIPSRASPIVISPPFLCPTKYKGVHAHAETLLKEVQKSGAKGVIFLLYKYCETHFFDYPDLKQALESKGIPTLLLEVEDPSYSIGQLKIRVQAFVEMLSPILEDCRFRVMSRIRISNVIKLNLGIYSEFIWTSEFRICTSHSIEIKENHVRE